MSRKLLIFNELQRKCRKNEKKIKKKLAFSFKICYTVSVTSNKTKTKVLTQNAIASDKQPKNTITP